jgi:signal transduction histidine kinase
MTSIILPSRAPMANLLDLFGALRLLPLEREEHGPFRPAAEVPNAFRQRFPALARPEFDLTAEFPFLADFLPDAELLWANAQSGSKKSGPWTQNDAAGHPVVLEATAVVVGAERTPYLLLELLGTEFAELQDMLQKARDQRLQFEGLSKDHRQLEASTQRLERMAAERQAAIALLRQAREQLEDRVAERTVDLREANAALLRQQEQLRSLADQLVVAEENERRQIAEFLHDRIGQNLALLKMRLRAAGQQAPAIGPALAEAGGLLDEVISDTRGLTADLGTPALYELGLPEALEQLVRRFEDIHGIPARFDDDEADKPLAERTRIVAYQAVRELLHNAVKHAEAESVEVRLARVGGSARLVVQDRGRGFDGSRFEYRVTPEGGFGLFNIRERVLHLGGTCSVASTPGLGTEVTLTLPLDL